MKGKWYIDVCTIELTYDPAIPLLGIYTDNILTWKDTGDPAFTVALFIIAKAWKQPKHLSTDEGIRRMWHIYTHTQWNDTQR